MSKRNNPLLRRTAPATVDGNAAVNPEVLSDDDHGPLAETFPGAKPLSVNERNRLSELEGIITQNFKAFYNVGCALREIQANQLYRETHTTFADYAKDLWDMARARAYQMIEAADIVDRLIPFTEHLSTTGRQNEKPIPQNERQARALAKYDEGTQIEIWQRAVETADGRITAAHIKKTARQLHGEKVEKTIRKARERTASPDLKISDGFRTAFNAMMDAINAERMTDWQNTDKDEAERHIKALWQAIAAPL